MEKLKFGTDGWRAVIAESFTYGNVRRVAQAACDAAKHMKGKKQIVVGYDHRFLSEDFALAAARVAQLNGFDVVMSDSPITSPVLSLQVKDKKARLGFMITASHNPPIFNGFKIKGPHGGSVGADVTEKIESCLEDVPPVKTDDAIKTADFVTSYVREIKKKISPSALKNLKHPVVVDAMYGPAGLVLDKIVGTNKKVHLLRSERNPLFGGQAPEPIEDKLGLLKETVLRSKADIGIGLDGDGDRIGVIDDLGQYVPPHTVMPLLLEYLITDRKLKGKIVQTVSMGYLPGRIAAHYKLPIEEVPVGFKNIAQRMQETKILFGGEESGGFGIGSWFLERDGILCGLLLIEILSKRKKKLSKLIEELYAKYGASSFQRVDFDLPRPVEKEAWTQAIGQSVPETLCDMRVQKVDTQDGIKIHLEDGSWVLLRPSGTEPLIRTYAEAPTPKVVKTLLSEAEKWVKSETEKKNKPARKSKAGASSGRKRKKV